MVFHTVNEESRKLGFFFNLPPFGDCLIYLGRMVDTLDDQNLKNTVQDFDNSK